MRDLDESRLERCWKVRSGNVLQTRRVVESKVPVHGTALLPYVHWIPKFETHMHARCFPDERRVEAQRVDVDGHDRAPIGGIGLQGDPVPRVVARRLLEAVRAGG